MPSIKFLKKIYEHKISILLFIVLPMTILFGIILLKFVPTTSDKSAPIKEDKVIYLNEQIFEDESYKEKVISANNVFRNPRWNFLHPSEYNKKGEIVFKTNNLKGASFYVVPQFKVGNQNSYFKLLISPKNEEYELLFSKEGEKRLYTGNPMIKLPPFDGELFIKVEMYVDKKHAKALLDSRLLSIEFFAKKWVEREHKSPNIVLFVIDALRADHLSCYGYKKKTTPNIDKFNRQGAIFYNAFSQANATTTSIASLITSRYSSDALEFSNKNKRWTHLEYQVRTLAEVLRVNGYKTAAFTANPFIKAEWGFSQGYESYNYIPPKKGDVKRLARAKALNQIVFEWLAKNSKERFFLYIHTMDVHRPYIPVSPYNHMFDPDYNGELLMTDPYRPSKRR